MVLSGKSSVGNYGDIVVVMIAIMALNLKHLFENDGKYMVIHPQYTKGNSTLYMATLLSIRIKKRNNNHKHSK